MTATGVSLLKHLRTKVVLIAALLGLLAGFMVSYAFVPRYTSESLVLLEGQRVPESIVQSEPSLDLSERVATLQQRALSAENLRPLIERLAIASGENVDGAIDGIRANVAINPVVTTALGPIPPGGKQQSALPAFNVAYTASNPRRAQEICAGVTDIMIREDLNDRVAKAHQTRDFLNQTLEDEKVVLMNLGGKLASLKNERRSRSADADMRKNLLAIEYASEQKSYEELLAKRRVVEIGATMTSLQLAETMSILNPADLPDVPEFPNRMLFSLGGLGGGLMMGIFVIPLFKLRREFRRKRQQQSLSQALAVPAANG